MMNEIVSLPPASETSSEKTSPTTPYTAVVYFHGMGQQRRHEEVSTLVEQINTLICNEVQLPPPTKLFPDEIVSFEPLTTPDTRRFTYQEMHVPPGPSPLPKTPQDVRFYEVYWANYTAEGTNAFSVLYWVALQWCMPIKVLLTPWREMPQVRLGALYGIYEQEDVRPADNELADNINTLTNVYSRFGEDEHVCNPTIDKGDFEAFLCYLADHTRQPDYSGPKFMHLLSLAREWKKKHTSDQIIFLAATTVLLVAVIMIVAAIGVAGLMVLGSMVRIGQPLMHATLPAPHEFLWLPLGLVLWFILTKLNVVLNDYLGDVQQYVTYQETNTKYERREAINRESKAILEHVLADTACERVVVIAHSLGTVIALDALLALKNGSTVPSNLKKIQHVVTMGSPINKVNYFFATRSRTPRYSEVVNDLRGNLSSLPFGEDHTVHAHWVNYWDRFDLISSPVLTVPTPIVERQRVDNVCVASYYIPDFFRSHSGYFYHEYVLSDIAAMLFGNEYNFASDSRRLVNDSRYRANRLDLWRSPDEASELGLRRKLLAHTRDVAVKRQPSPEPPQPRPQLSSESDIVLN